MYLPPIPHLWNRRSSQVRSEGWSRIDRIFQEGGKGARRSHQMYVPISHSCNPYPYTPLPLPLGTFATCFSLPPSPLFSPSRKSTFYCSYGSHSALPHVSHCFRSARPVLMTDLVYNSRKRGGDSADRYFKATEMIAGVKDMRFQAIMPDTLHWLGVQKIDNMISMVRSYFNSPYFSMLYLGTDDIE
jgi:hypothetical protein